MEIYTYVTPATSPMSNELIIQSFDYFLWSLKSNTFFAKIKIY